MKEKHIKLVRAADELRKAIYDDMYHRISIAKTHHRRSMFIVVSCSIAALLLMVGMLYFFYGWVFHPIRRLQQGVRHVAAGEFHHPIGLTTGVLFYSYLLLGARNRLQKRSLLELQVPLHQSGR